MTGFQIKLEQFDIAAAECKPISKLARSGTKREMYLQIASQDRNLASDLSKGTSLKKPHRTIHVNSLRSSWRQ